MNYTDVGEVVKTGTSEFKWIVKFSDCSKYDKGEVFISPTITMTIKKKIHKWQFFLHLVTRDYVSIYVRNLTNRGFNLTVKLSVLNAENKKEKSYIYSRPNYTSAGHSAWGTLGFIKRSDVEDEANGLLINGALTVLCEIMHEECYQSTSSDSISFESNASRTNADFSPASVDGHGFEALLDDEKYSDVKFIVDNKVIKAHKCILAKKSVVLEKMFQHNTTGKKHNVVKITDMSYNVLKEMLRFIYGGKINNMKKIAVNLLPVANKYMLEEQKTKCEESLSANLNIENVIEYVRFADTHNANILKTKAIQFIVSNTEKLMVKAELKSLSHTHPESMYSRFRALSKKVEECMLMIKN